MPHRSPFGSTSQLRILLASVAISAALQPGPAGADTFSIAAVELESGQLGSAGASCVGQSRFFPDGAFVLSDILPGIGVIHTQASYLAENQQNARARMLEGMAPQDIVDWLEANDARGDAGPRQYGIVDLRREGLSAAFTGASTIDHAGHRTGPGYSVQGNILSGPEILDDMESAYLAAEGQLAERLMAALEAAKVVGADTRCEARGTSSQSAFIQLRRPEDGAATYLRLVVPDSEPDQDPIDQLRADFDAWRAGPTITPGASLTPLPSASATTGPGLTPTAEVTSTPLSTPTPSSSPSPSTTPTPVPSPIFLPYLDAAAAADATRTLTRGRGQGRGTPK